MARDALEVAPRDGHAERRGPPRKRVLLSGVVVDSLGDNPSDCTIRNISERGAQVSSLGKKLPVAAQVYLVDTRNQTAYLATVAWSEFARSGLAFIRSYALDQALSPQVKFLGKLFIEAKLRQIENLIKRGLSVEDATRLVGMTEDQVCRFGETVSIDEKIGRVLGQAKEMLNK